MVAVLRAFAGLTFRGGEVRHPKGRFQKGGQNLRDKIPGAKSHLRTPMERKKKKKVSSGLKRTVNENKWNGPGQIWTLNNCSHVV